MSSPTNDLGHVQAQARPIARQWSGPVVTWLGHVTISLQVGALYILLGPTLAEFAGSCATLKHEPTDNVRP